MGFKLERPAELEREAEAHDEQVDVSNVIVTSLSEFSTKQRWDELNTWLAEGPSEWPAEWQSEELDELLAGISEENLHKIKRLILAHQSGRRYGDEGVIRSSHPWRLKKIR